MTLNAEAFSVLCRYPGLGLISPPTALGNHGGFSGARLWRVETSTGLFCLRAWPSGDPLPARLLWLHQLIAFARSAGLDFVPRVMPAQAGVSWVEQGGRLWELTAWMPGKADFRNQPTRSRLQSACVALARLHLVWSSVEPSHGPCPAIQRRLDRAREFAGLLKSGWNPIFTGELPGQIHTLGKRVWQILLPLIDRIPAILAPWIHRPFRLQPCLCDVWHDHVLFEGDHVSGIIDYGSVKNDCVAVDLARLLGSLVGDEEEQWTAGIQAYESVQPLTIEERALSRALDHTGVLIGAVNWLKWLYREGRKFDDRTGVVKRLESLIERVEKWS